MGSSGALFCIDYCFLIKVLSSAFYIPIVQEAQLYRKQLVTKCADIFNYCTPESKKKVQVLLNQQIPLSLNKTKASRKT